MGCSSVSTKREINVEIMFEKEELGVEDIDDVIKKALTLI